MTESFEEQGGGALPKMSVAKDGHSQAHMDVLVAVFGRAPHPCSFPKTSRLGAQKRATSKDAALL